MKKLRVLDLFAGIGGFSLGLERTGGFSTVAFCEIDSFCQKVLKKHWPEVPIYEDIRKLTKANLAADGITGINVITGGFPCQNISIAGAAHGVDVGLEGEKSILWFEYARLIEELQPEAAIIENVNRLPGNGLDGVLRSLARIGYDAEWDIISGYMVGLPQARKRICIIAYPSGKRMEGLFSRLSAGPAGQGWACSETNLFDVAHSAFGGDDRFPQPLLRGMDDRPSNWMDRIRTCGNAYPHQIPEMIGHAILESMKQQPHQGQL